MKVLFVTPDYWKNPYCVELAAALNGVGCSVTNSLADFWQVRGEYDVVHLHWPESLYTPGLTPSWTDLRMLTSDVLLAWNKKASLILTLHNEQTHNSSEIGNAAIHAAVRLVGGVIHLGEESRARFEETGKKSHQQHIYIPHQTYSSIPYIGDRKKSKQSLKFSEQTKLILAFGELRHPDERDYLLKGFGDLPFNPRVLVAPRFGALVRPSRRRRPLQWARWEWKNRQVIPPARLDLNRGYLSTNETALLFSAADVVVIPRLNTLNSGVLPLAFQMGRVAVGPDNGNIGHLLRESGNPTFDPADSNSLVRAICKGLEADGEGLGERNRLFAEASWAPKSVAEKHILFYREVSELHHQQRDISRNE
jgi:glycosyltransferase involved in cell wall biosynthesis